MLVLFETPAGFALFKVLDEGKLKKLDSLWEQFQDADKAQKIVQLQAFHKFENTTEALAAATALHENDMSKSLKSFIKKSIVDKQLHDKLAVSESKLGSTISEKFSIKCVSDKTVAELMRGIRSQLNNLIAGLSETDMHAMVLGLSHSLSRYKIKFSPDKVDTMIVQAIGLLDDLDKELNTYAMRVKEWYGWHFPEMQKIVPDNILYARTVKALGVRGNIATAALSDVLPEELEEELKEAAQISMGTEISEDDLDNITALCDEVIEMDAYRAQLFEYLKNRMNAIAPNLTVLVGELVGARLIAHAGSLMSLAKHPASTVQILGAEKALFRALKTKHATPKYGLIYHASLIGQATSKNKGKMSRVLANKCALSIRVDALGDKDTPNIGIENREKVEARLRQLEGREIRAPATPKQNKFDKYSHSRSASDASTVRTSAIYNDAADAVTATPSKKDKKDKKKKKKHAEAEAEAHVEAAADEELDDDAAPSSKKDKKKKDKKKHREVENGDDDEPAMEIEADEHKKKKDKKKRKRDADADEEADEAPVEATPKKHKKHKNKE